MREKNNKNSMEEVNRIIDKCFEELLDKHTPEEIRHMMYEYFEHKEKERDAV